MSYGDKVRVRPPFDQAYPGEYIVEEVRTLEDGSIAVRIAGTDFSPAHLELI